GENSPFAQELLRALRYNPHPLPTDQLFVQVRDAVMQATEGQQIPIFDNINVKGDDQGQFVFVPAASDVSPDLPPPELQARSRPQPQSPQLPAGLVLVSGGTFLMGDVLGDKE
ncbi:hypothetical protein RZS08_35215, partial [Arthrospira platensis SPKY1]|nr:hypothetical protein [Arthrospira platensis SPKY1]